MTKRAKNALVTFSKRRKGLLSKASELCTKCDSRVAVLVVSPSGNAFSFGHSSVDRLLRRYDARNTAAAEEDDGDDSAASERWRKKARELEELRARVRARGKERIGRGDLGFADENFQTVEELESLRAKYLNLLWKVRRKLGNDGSLVPAGSFGQGNDGSFVYYSFCSGSSTSQCNGVPFRAGTSEGGSGSGGGGVLGGQENDMSFSLMEYNNNNGGFDLLCGGSPEEGTAAVKGNDASSSDPDGLSIDFGYYEDLHFSGISEENFHLCTHQESGRDYSLHGQENYMSFACESGFDSVGAGASEVAVQQQNVAPAKQECGGATTVESDGDFFDGNDLSHLIANYDYDFTC